MTALTVIVSGTWVVSFIIGIFKPKSAAELSPLDLNAGMLLVLAYYFARKNRGRDDDDDEE